MQAAVMQPHYNGPTPIAYPVQPMQMQPINHGMAPISNVKPMYNQQYVNPDQPPIYAKG
jgi:hypothetical protein